MPKCDLERIVDNSDEMAFNGAYRANLLAIPWPHEAKGCPPKKQHLAQIFAEV
jgi:hypothetical protein